MEIKKTFPEYVHHGSWWAVEANRAPVLAFMRGKQWAARTAITPAITEYTHGRAEVFGVILEAFMDLGGDFNLVHRSIYPTVLKRITDGIDRVSRVVPLDELGCSPKGRPIDMAGGTTGASSIVHVDLWVETTINLTMASGRRVILHRQLVGFVDRSSPMLILGIPACVACGYHTVPVQEKLLAASTLPVAEQSLILLPEGRTGRGGGIVTDESITDHSHSPRMLTRGGGKLMSGTGDDTTFASLQHYDPYATPGGGGDMSDATDGTARARPGHCETDAIPGGGGTALRGHSATSLRATCREDAIPLMESVPSTCASE